MIVLAVPIGLLVGVVMGSMGGGGAVLSVPILVYGFSMTAHAASTAALIIVGVGAIVGVLAHRRTQSVQWREGLLFGLAGAPLAWGGSLLAARLDQDVLLLAFAVLLVIVAVLMLRRSPTDTGRTERAHPGVVLLAAAGVGALTGFFGVGGGFAVVPAMVLVLGLSMKQAIGTSLLVILMNSVVALSSRAGGSDLDWPLVAVFAAAGAVGNLLGARFSARLSGDRLRFCFGILLLAIAVYVGSQASVALAT